MTRSVLVTGGTGTVGRSVVECLREAGHAVRIASRRARPATARVGWATVDYRTGAGLRAALAGVDTIVHCARDHRGGADRTAIAAARSAGVAHLVYISIVGVDRIPFSYYRVKLGMERLLADSGVPWTILRTTQFHDLMLTGLAALARLPVLPVLADVSFQPIDAVEVGRRLAALAEGPPAGHVRDMGGPRVHSTRTLAQIYLAASGRRRRVVPVWLPGRAAAGFRAGHHLTPHRTGTITFEQHLSRRFPGAFEAARSRNPAVAEAPLSQER